MVAMKVASYSLTTPMKMKSAKWAVLTAAFCNLGSAGALEKQLCAVEKVGAGPLVDGVRDACYARALPIREFYVAGEMKPAPEQTEARFVHDGQTLYGIVTCRQADAASMPVGSERHDDEGIWSGNSLEMFILPSDGLLRHFMISNAGGVYDARCRMDEAREWRADAAWESGMRTAVRRGGDSWSVEFSLPLKAIGCSCFKFNLARDRPVMKESSSWARLDEFGWLPKGEDNAKFGGMELLKGAFPADFAAALPAPQGPDRKVEIVRNGKTYYRHLSPKPVPFLKMEPANLKRGALYLDGHRGVKATIVWNSRHNFPNQDKSRGNCVVLNNSLVFEVPPGVTVLKAEKTGTVERNGRMYDVFEQRETFAYNSSGWMGSAFTAKLPAGSEGVVRYGVKYPGGEQAMKEVPCRVVSVPDVPAVPKRFMTGHYGNIGLRYEDAAYWRGLGVNTFPLRGYGKDAAELARKLKADGYLLRRGDYFWPGACDGSGYAWQRWTVEDETARAIDREGRPIPQGRGYQLSPAYRGKCYREAIAKEVAFLKGLGYDFVSFDMEDYVQKQGEVGDFSPATVAEFKRRWAAAHPGTPVPEPREFEAEPAAHPVEHAEWVETKCELWGGFFETMKNEFRKGTGSGIEFTEWSMGALETVDERNHSLRSGRFFRAFDYFEIDVYSGIDRDLRTMEYCRDSVQRFYPGTPFKLIITPCPVRLGTGEDGPSNFYYTNAPEVRDETVCVFKEAATLGAKGVYTWTLSLVDVEYLRQFAIGVNLIVPVEDIVMNGTVRDLETDYPNDAVIKDKFMGRMQTRTNQKRVFARANTLGKRTLVSVSEYRQTKPMTVRIRFPHEGKVRVRDLETGDCVAVLGAKDVELAVALTADRRCRLLLAEPCAEDR